MTRNQESDMEDDKTGAEVGIVAETIERYASAIKRNAREIETMPVEVVQQHLREFFDDLREKNAFLVGLTQGPAGAAEDETICDICAKPILPGDICSTDVDMGPVHTACGEGSAHVNFDTGEEVDGPIPTFVWGDEGTGAAARGWERACRMSWQSSAEKGMEILRLRKALRPFAYVVESGWGQALSDEVAMVIHRVDAPLGFARITVGDLRGARDALERTGFSCVLCEGADVPCEACAKANEKLVPCPCTLIAQDESCPVGYPSLLCDECDGKGVIPAKAEPVAAAEGEAVAWQWRHPRATGGKWVNRPDGEPKGYQFRLPEAEYRPLYTHHASPEDPEALRRERDEARQIVRDIHWMARRYADGRMSYAVGMFNDAVRKAFNAGWLTWNNDEPKYASDGMFDKEWISDRDARLLAEARATTAEQRIESATRAIDEAIGCFDAAEAEGMSDRISEARNADNFDPASLAGLFERRVAFALPALYHARAALDASKTAAKAEGGAE